jgi:hypothetical protein
MRQNWRQLLRQPSVERSLTAGVVLLTAFLLAQPFIRYITETGAALLTDLMLSRR